MSERGHLTFGETIIEYTVVRGPRRRKTVEITLDPAAGVVVAAPAELPTERIHAIVTKRAGWIVRRTAAGLLLPPPKRFVSGESLPYLGRQVRLTVQHAAAKRTDLKFQHWSFDLVVPASLSGDERRSAARSAAIRWYRRRASERLRGRVQRWAQIVGIEPPAVQIRDQRQRWASCGQDGTLRFNWRIMMAPPALIDYVVVHELVHLRMRNHSPQFWTELARLMPDYKPRRARLKEVGPSLTF